MLITEKYGSLKHPTTYVSVLKQAGPGGGLVGGMCRIVNPVPNARAIFEF